MVAMTFQRGGPGGEEAADVEAEQAGASSALTKVGRIPRSPNNDPEAGYKRARKHRPRGKGGKGKNKDKEEDSSEAMDEDDAAGTQGGSDHPAVIPKECYALVVSPRIDGYDFSKCLMDGGASLNIMYLETLEKMNLTKEQLKHSTTEFHGVVPGKKANSLGSIKLPVAFGNVNNYREEMITFEVVPFKSSYHVIFGRPTYHKFHARACYIYNKLKIRVLTAGSPCHIPTTMQRCLKDQIGRNVHAYVDDIAVMTRKGSDLLSDLKETFDNLRRLVTRFGIPHSIITDNGTNFAQGELKDYCDEVGIRLDLASVAHPQSNGQVERANGLILAGIKPRLEEPLAAQRSLG
ncbi:hypothetical protein QYE76_036339 [Lolium multiflorum]|uniref:Integrase catalytic domain-containing protein n=1 Tax=Lolium multiflorum TaxID=4521 RepID=A0AAD8VPA1_LOLMU|nr:hypothetical protein QYE76_036339 [Lolium multiflorum]